MREVEEKKEEVSFRVKKEDSKEITSPEIRQIEEVQETKELSREEDIEENI